MLALDALTQEQQALVEAIKSGPRGRFSNDGPFAVYLQAPGLGQLAQQLGAHLRFGTSVPPRLAEVAILFTAQYSKSAPRDEQAIYAFVKELYATRRVSNATYARVHKLLGDAGTVELVGMLGYYVMVSMILDAFRMPAPEGTPAPFREPGSK
jgi:4-carboxymuconolactone decarboxylase